MSPHAFTRRSALFSSGLLIASTAVPYQAFAAGGRDTRLLVVNLRGALDGLAAVAPIGDPAYEAARSGLVLKREGPQAGLALDGFFLLNPAMKTLHGLYQRKEALIAHAVASPYRERSHFDGQDVLESGLPGVGRPDSGWLNRALQRLPMGENLPVKALAVEASVPLIMRGPAPVVTWMPPGYPNAADETRQRLLSLYRHTAPDLAERLDTALTLKKTAQTMAMPKGQTPGPREISAFREAALAAGQLMAREDGPRIGAMSFLGWDTHADEKPLDGRLSTLLLALDAALDGYETAMKPVWSKTVIVCVTEFGRTVKMNGTFGTDHGTATIAVLAGGAVKGGRMLADWPGLADKALYQGRDLAPTTDLRALFKGVLRDHLGLDAAVLARDVFPDSGAVKPFDGLIV